MPQVSALTIAKGMATFFPGVVRLACGASGGTDSARYCYTVWLRHLKRLADAGVRPEFPTVAELGPGDSLGVGLCAMLTGSDRYFAFDSVTHARTSSNLEMLEEVSALIAGREALSGNDEFPELSPSVTSLAFPAAMLPDDRLSDAMRPDRVSRIRKALEGDSDGGIELRYFAPWTHATLLNPNTVDLAVSQAVLEHVDDIESAYDALFLWLKPGGVMSHQIDFKSHGLTRDWWGHWSVPSWLWRVMRGRRPYLINRLPASAHLAAMRNAGFEIIIADFLYRDAPPRAELAAEFRSLDDDDLRTAGVYVIARKPGHLS